VRDLACIIERKQIADHRLPMTVSMFWPRLRSGFDPRGPAHRQSTAGQATANCGKGAEKRTGNFSAWGGRVPRGPARGGRRGVETTWLRLQTTRFLPCTLGPGRAPGRRRGHGWLPDPRPPAALGRRPQLNVDQPAFSLLCRGKKNTRFWSVFALAGAAMGLRPRPGHG